MKAYHFLREDRRLGYGDRRLVKVGQTLTVKGEPVLSEHGLHASADILDALRYSPGPILCEVELGGTIIEGDDKVVASERTCLSIRDVSRELRLFAVRCARRALSRIENPDPRSIAACDVSERHVNGEATDEELAAAWAAATAAWDAARAAARAASAAARDAAWDAARAAARAAARDAAWDAEREAQREDLIELLGL